MNSYLIEIENDILKIDFNRSVSVEGDLIVQDAQARLTSLIESGEISGGELLKINGPSPVLVAYTLAHNLTHLYKAVAVSDTRLGAYVVVTSTHPLYKVGTHIDFTTGKVKEVFPSAPTKPTFLMNWDGDIFKAELNRQVQVDGDVIVRDVESQLNQLIDSKQLKGGKLLKINGRASILASYIIAHKLAHLYGAIAVYDPKIGERGLDKYVIVISHNEYHVGDTLEIATKPPSNLKVVLCGPINTGKTCLRQGLKQSLLQLQDAPDSYVISGCPDGDGSWFSETAQKHPELAKALKKEYKAGFTLEFARSKAKEIEVIKTPLLIFDVGGKITPENEIIMQGATHAVILAKTDEEIVEWQNFCQKLNIPVIAVIYSDLKATADIIEQEYPLLLKGTIHHLDRFEDASSRPMIKALAQLLADLASGRK